MTKPLLRRNPHIPRSSARSNRKGDRGFHEDSSSRQLDCTKIAGEPSLSPPITRAGGGPLDDPGSKAAQLYGGDVGAAGGDRFPGDGLLGAGSCTPDPGQFCSGYGLHLDYATVLSE